MALGSGSFGYVRQIKWKGRDAALKVMKGGSETELELFRKEVALMRQVHSSVILLS